MGGWFSSQNKVKMRPTPGVVQYDVATSADAPPPTPPVKLNLWDKRHPQQQEIVRESEEYKNLLGQKLTELISIVKVKPLLPILDQLEVISFQDKAMIQKNTINADMVACLVHYLEGRPLWKMHGFFRALAESGQQHVITEIGLNSSAYNDDDTNQDDEMVFDTSNLVIDPFANLSQLKGMEYFQQYVKVMHGQPGNAVLDIVKNHESELKWVFENSLLTHLFSLLVANDMLSSGDIQCLTIEKLLKQFENYVLLADGNDATASTHSFRFYSLCLQCTLNGVKEIKETYVDISSPYLIFLKRHMSDDGSQNNYFTFKDDMFVDFFTSQYIIEYIKRNSQYESPLLVLLCAMPQARNILKLVCNYISQYEHDMLHVIPFTLRASLILQTRKNPFAKSEITEELLGLPLLIEQTITLDWMYKTPIEQQAEQISHITDTIRKAFTKNAAKLKAEGWFLNAFHEFPSMGLQKFITLCLKTLSPSEQEKIYAVTTHCLLPCSQYNVQGDDGLHYDFFAIPVNAVRWAIICDRVPSQLQRDLYAWCPLDMKTALQESYCLNYNSLAKSGSLNLHLAECSDLWGHISCDMLSEDVWCSMLRDALVQQKPRSINVFADYVSRGIQMDGLLAAIPKLLATQSQNQQGAIIEVIHITIWYGQFSEGNLEEFIKVTVDGDVRVGLYFPKIVLSVGHSHQSAYLLDVRVNLSQLLDGEYHNPTYLTADGKMLSLHHSRVVGVQTGLRRQHSF